MICVGTIGDHLLASQQESQQWSQTRDVNTNLHYPQNGIGAVITYLEVICEQVISSIFEENPTRKTIPFQYVHNSRKRMCSSNQFPCLFQSSFLGQAYIVAGGVGQRQIAIVIEARQTLYFSYRASIFGY